MEVSETRSALHDLGNELNERKKILGNKLHPTESDKAENSITLLAIYD